MGVCLHSCPPMSTKYCWQLPCKIHRQNVATVAQATLDRLGDATTPAWPTGKSARSSLWRRSGPERSIALVLRPVSLSMVVRRRWEPGPDDWFRIATSCPWMNWALGAKQPGNVTICDGLRDFAPWMTCSGKVEAVIAHVTGSRYANPLDRRSSVQTGAVA